jgi:hypothetical protein
MWRRTGLVLLLSLLPAAARAEDAPEQLLPATTQVYLRWDGVDAHRAAYEKTALGQMMQGDTGGFITELYTQTQEGLSALLTVEQLLGGVAPDKLAKMQADAAEAAKLLQVLAKSGAIVAGEVHGVENPEWQVTIILPDAGEKPGPAFGAIRLFAALNKIDIKEDKLEGRAVSSITGPAASLTWWTEGKHAVVVVGTDKPDKVLKTMRTGNHARLPSSPLYKRVHDFKEFETSARAFVDTAALVKTAASRGKEFDKLMKDLGLDGLKSLVYYSGFDGEAERGLVEWDVPGPRKGALALLNGKPFTIADLPPLPPDVTGWSMTNFEPSTAYDVVFQAIEAGTAIASPDDVAKVKAYAKQLDEALGVDLKKDLLDALGDRLVLYSSPGEGPLSLGQTVMFRVKDAKKVQEALDQAVKGLGKASGADVTLKKKMYHGVEMREVHVAQQGFIFVPSYVVTKDWLVMSYYPQAVQGFILRSKGEMEAWKADEHTKKALEQLPKEFVSVGWSDPRPSVKQVLQIAPLIAGSINSFTPDSKFEVGSLPNAQEATRHLFPNVFVTSDDGKTLRLESRASLVLPIDLTGLDSYAIFIAFSFARFAF